MLKRPRDINNAGSTNEKCCFCGEDAANIIEGAFPKAYCLLHYYTTRACRKNTKNVRLLNNSNLITGKEGQVIQGLFADAFVSLQSEINEAASRYDPKDPLSVIDNSIPKKTSLKQTSKNFKMKKVDGGFMPDITDLEKELMEQHMKSSTMKEEPLNPYRRKKFPSSTVWHQAMNSSSDVIGAVTPLYLDKCSCGSDKVMYDGNKMCRSEEGAKAEIWGSKQDHDAVDRYRCLTCGTSWNRLE